MRMELQDHHLLRYATRVSTSVVFRPAFFCTSQWYYRQVLSALCLNVPVPSLAFFGKDGFFMAPSLWAVSDCRIVFDNSHQIQLWLTVFVLYCVRFVASGFPLVSVQSKSKGSCRSDWYDGNTINADRDSVESACLSVPLPTFKDQCGPLAARSGTSGCQMTCAATWASFQTPFIPA